MIETAQHERAATRIADWIGCFTPGVPVGAGTATMPAVANFGARWFNVSRGPLFVALGAAPFVQRITEQSASGTVISSARWVRFGTDSLWLEPFEAPRISGALAVYSPTLLWLYMPHVGVSTIRSERAELTARLVARGMSVEWIGLVRALVTAVPKTRV